MDSSKIKSATALTKDFSIIPVNSAKIPTVKTWKPYQSTPMTGEQLKDISVTTGATDFAIITGYNNLQCIDVDTKILDDEQERVFFESNFFALLRDHIPDFDNKIALYRTRSGGFHLLFRCREIEGNKKIARIRGKQEALIETRGKYGYVVAYFENKVSELDYSQIKEITPEEREVILFVCRMFDEVPEPQEPPKKKKTISTTATLSAWDDFNQNTDVWDLIRDEFTIVGKRGKYTAIKRHGAKSAYSGYIFDNGIYLFSTGTRYPAQKLLTPYHILAYQYNGGDIIKTAQELYKIGYGERRGKIKT
ncbi:Bifunctional DNA primase/polymerase, N-terminal [Chryseobacterium taklimakanense]|uniref:Bifunctional DNA primase/polymerase, N-terminal n=1 Tax=Chryseobacterium taklimakanense TaxID=536441 RepID=A0A239X8B9_9FLAO|nr:bifunctional DNA primase/polymerase [Chryseobacterium taklimakanense]SNV42965.1 Bifunctional DNA primase/polymerase, N-terminal [Chryseobacterium taklimakanense]